MCLCVCFAQDEDINPGIKEMEAMILECAKLDSEINYFVDIVQQATAEVNHNVSQSESSKWKALQHFF